MRSNKIKSNCKHSNTNKATANCLRWGTSVTWTLNNSKKPSTKKKGLTWYGNGSMSKYHNGKWYTGSTRCRLGWSCNTGSHSLRRRSSCSRDSLGSSIDPWTKDNSRWSNWKTTDTTFLQRVYIQIKKVKTRIEEGHCDECDALTLTVGDGTKEETVEFLG